MDQKHDAQRQPAGRDGPDERCRSVARRRKRAILTEAARGPISVDDVLHEFPPGKGTGRKTPEQARYEKARVAVKQLVRSGRLIEVGEVQLREWGSKPRKLYAVPSLKVNRWWLLHDAMLWKYLRTLRNARVVAGYDDELALRQDAKVWFSNGRIGHCEMDCDSESLKVFEDKLEPYERAIRIADPAKGERQTEYLLVVSVSENRLGRLQRRIEPRAAGKFTFFANWYDLMEDSCEKLWQDARGTKVRLYPVGG